MKGKGLELLFKKDLKIFLVAIGLGVVSILLLNAYVSSKTKSEEMVSVIVAGKDIPEGAVIEKSMVREKQIPKSMFHFHMHTPSDLTIIEGRTAKISIPAGMPILADYILVRKGSGFSEKLNPDFHERVKQLSLKGPISYLKSEDLIDIIAIPKEGSKIPRILLPKVLVLDKAGSDLLLKVSDKEALVLTRAEKEMELSFILRHPEDVEVDTGAIELDFLKDADKVRKERIQREKLIIRHY